MVKQTDTVPTLVQLTGCIMHQDSSSAPPRLLLFSDLVVGYLTSPLILEYSGIGLKEVLDNANVTQIVELSVGINQQDLITTGMGNRANEAGEGHGQAAYFASFEETFRDFADEAYDMLSD